MRRRKLFTLAAGASAVVCAAFCVLWVWSYLPERVWVKILEQTTAGAPSLYKAIAEFLSRNRSRPEDKELLASLERAIGKFKGRVKNLSLAPEGSFSIGPLGYFGVLMQVAIVAAVTAAASRRTVNRTIAENP